MADAGLIVGYSAAPPRGHGSGLRVHRDGTVELCEEGSEWRRIATLTEAEAQRLVELTRAAGIPELPPEVSRPAGLVGGSDCEWWTDLGGRAVHSVIHGWTDDNPAALPSRGLVMELSKLVSAAQAREVSDSER
jgi:hypothetical protein